VPEGKRFIRSINPIMTSKLVECFRIARALKWSVGDTWLLINAMIKTVSPSGKVEAGELSLYRYRVMLRASKECGLKELRWLFGNDFEWPVRTSAV